MKKQNYAKVKPHAYVWEQWLKQYRRGFGSLICPGEFGYITDKEEEICKNICKPLFPEKDTNSCPCQEYGPKEVARVVRKFLKAIKEGATL